MRAPGVDAESLGADMTALDTDDAHKVRLWLEHLQLGTTGEQMLVITLDAEEALTRYRERLEAA